MDTPERNTDDAAPKRRLNSSIVAAGVAFGITLAGLGVASAQTDEPADTTSTTAAPSDTTAGREATPDATAAPAEGTPPAAGSGTAGRGPRARAPRVAETELTGEVAEKVRAAALAAIPDGTIIRVETDSDGSPYKAHVRKADGTAVVLKIDAHFNVTATEEGHGGRGGRHRGPGGGGAPAVLSGEAADKVTSAALAAVPGGTIVRVQAGPGDGYHAHVTNAEGSEVVVQLNADFDVTGTVAGSEFHPGGPGGHRGPRPADSDSGTTESD